MQATGTGDASVTTTTLTNQPKIPHVTYSLSYLPSFYVEFVGSRLRNIYSNQLNQMRCDAIAFSYAVVCPQEVGGDKLIPPIVTEPFVNLRSLSLHQHAGATFRNSTNAFCCMSREEVRLDC